MSVQRAESRPRESFDGEPPLTLAGRTPGEIRTGGAPRCPSCHHVQRIGQLVEKLFNRCPTCKAWFWFEVDAGDLYPFLTNLEGPAYRPCIVVKPKGRRKRKAVANAAP